MTEEQKTLEMRVAELEDKLAQLHISEEDMATFNKVAAKLNARSGLISPQGQVQQQVSPNQFRPISPIYYNPIYFNPIYFNPIFWADCIQQCFTAGGPAAGGANFKNLGG